MQQISYPANYAGELIAPASKSYLQRAIAIASLSKTPCLIQNYYPSNDALAALNIARTLGAAIRIEGDNLAITGNKKSLDAVTIHCGEAGLSARMFAPIAAVLSEEVCITGEGSLLTRPMLMLIDALTKLKVFVHSERGFLPIYTKGKLQPAHIRIDGSESSQVLTGLLIALPLLDSDSIIEVLQLKSIPYIQMTLDILADFNVTVKHDNYKTFWIKGNQRPTAESYQVEGDWSGAAFHLVGAAIGGSIKLNNLNTLSAQADRAILDALKSCGAMVKMEKNSVSVAKNTLNAFEFDATDCPDLFPPLAALAAACNGTSTLFGTERLTHKESNRALSLQTEMAKVGIKIELSDNKMHITGGEINGALVSSQNDHRIAMAMAVLGLIAKAPIEISDAEAVNKSYPTFFEDFKMACV